MTMSARLRTALAGVSLCAVLAVPLSATPAGARVSPLPAQWQKGVNVTAFWWTDLSGKRFAHWLKAARTQVHADRVTFVVTWYQRFSRHSGRVDHLNATTIEPSYGSARRCRNIGSSWAACKTPSMAALSSAVRKARREGFKVAIRPQVDVGRGPLTAAPRDAIDIQGADRKRWFASYSRMLSQYARLARDTHADTLVVGSDLTGMTNDPEDRDYWHHLILDTRSGALLGSPGKGFTGALTYASTWKEALVKAVDFAPDCPPDLIAGRLIDEILRDPGAVEIGYQGHRRVTVGLSELPAEDGEPGLNSSRPSSVQAARVAFALAHDAQQDRPFALHQERVVPAPVVLGAFEVGLHEGVDLIGRQAALGATGGIPALLAEAGEVFDFGLMHLRLRIENPMLRGKLAFYLLQFTAITVENHVVSYMPEWRPDSFGTKWKPYCLDPKGNPDNASFQEAIQVDPVDGTINYGGDAPYSVTFSCRLGAPVTCRTDSAAPPRESPSSLVSTTPVSGKASLKARAVLTASWPSIASTTNRVSIGLTAA